MPPPMTAQQAQVAQAQALQAAQRNPFWPGGAPPAMLAAGLPANLFGQIQAQVAAAESSTAMVGTAKLGNCIANPETNSPQAMRISVRKFGVNGAPLSVAQWTRKTVEENLDWLVKLSKRHFPNENSIILSYGDGCETLVLLDDQVGKVPSDIRSIKKIGVGVSMVDGEDTSDEAELARHGVLVPTDLIWEHLRFEQITNHKDKKEKFIFIHTSVSIYGDSVEGRRRVLNVKTGAPKNLYVGVVYAPNAIFEQQVLAKWKEQGSSGGTLVAGVENEILITFNPRELILLEKAFDNLLTNKDRKLKDGEWTPDEMNACQRIIKRSHNEFVFRGPPRKRRKKSEMPAKDETAAKAATPAPKKAAPAAKKAASPKKAAPAAKKATTAAKKAASPKKAAPAAKKATKVAEKEVDSDDEPISKLKAKAATPAKKGTKKSTGGKKTTPAKTSKVKEEPKKKGRPPKSTTSKETPKKSAKKKK